MINNISWENYAYTLVILLIFYYAFVLVFLFGGELRSGISKLRKNAGYSTQEKQILTGENSLPDSIGDTDLDDHNTSIGELLLHLQSLIQNAATRDFPKEELLLSLQLELKKHRGLRTSVHLDTINNFIISECKNYCSMHLNGYEVGSIWGR